MRDIVLITAMGRNMEIGKDNKLLCSLKDDMKIFRRVSMGQVVVMGRKTFESIGKPLVGRLNIVMTRDKNYKADGVIICHSVEEVLKLRSESYSHLDLLVIGGSQIYEQFLPHATVLSITHIHAFFEDADTFFPEIDLDWVSIDLVIEQEANEDNDYPFTSRLYVRYEDTI